MASDLRILIVTYNGGRTYVRECLRTLGDLRSSVIVVDNASPDGTARTIQEEWPGVAVVALTDNVGFGRACNEGFLHVDADADVLLLNPDTRASPDVVLEARRRLHSQGAGLLGVRLERQDGSLDRACLRNLPDLVSALFYLLRMPPMAATLVGRNPYTLPSRQYYRDVPAEALNGAFMLYSAAARRSVGGFDDRFFMYGEDLDLARRVASAGFPIAYCGSLLATHLKSASAGEIRAWRVHRAFYESMWLYHEKYRGRSSAARAGSFVLRLLLSGLMLATYLGQHVRTGR